jgi:hypothetical protein
MELTAGNLSRPRALAANVTANLWRESCFPPDLRAPASKSLRLGWDFHTSANCFQICPRPLHTCRTKNSHALHKIDFRWPYMYPCPCPCTRAGGGPAGHPHQRRSGNGNGNGRQPWRGTRGEPVGRAAAHRALEALGDAGARARHARRGSLACASCSLALLRTHSPHTARQPRGADAYALRWRGGAQ